jgi:hypothetical protein
MTMPWTKAKAARARAGLPATRSKAAAAQYL